MRARALIAGILLLAAGCARGEQTVVVGAVYPTAGGQGTGGVEEYRGVQVAAELVNADGGVDGKKIRLELAPTDSAEAVPDAMRALKGKGADVIVGSYGSTLSTVAGRIASQEDVVFWETGAVGEVPGSVTRSERFFRVAPTGWSLGREASLFVHDVLLPKLGVERDLRYGVAYVDDVYGRAVGNGAIDGIEESGGKPETFPYTLRDTDYASIAKRIGEKQIDVVVVGAYLEDGIALRRALVREGVKLVTGIGTSSSYCMPEFGKRLGRDAVGLFASDKPDGPSIYGERLTDDARQALESAQRLYERRHGEQMSAAALAGLGGAWALFRHVLPAADTFDAAGIAAAAKDTRLPVGALPNGSGLDVSTGDNARAVSVIWQWTRPGYRTIVWPPAFAWDDIQAIAPR